LKKQFVLTGLGLSGILVGVLIVGLAAGFAVQSGQRSPATPAAPCGPNIPGDLGINAAKNSRCFELRMYTVDTSKSRINDLHKRFRDGEVDIFKKNGMEVLGAWQSLDDRSEEHTSELQSLAYLVCRLLLEKKKKKIKH